MSPDDGLQVPKVNALHAARALAKDAEASGALGDSRFSQMFADKDFVIDEESKDYQVLHPNATLVRYTVCRHRQ
jgi:ribosome biogenesis protein ENP2